MSNCQPLFFIFTQTNAATRRPVSRAAPRSTCDTGGGCTRLYVCGCLILFLSAPLACSLAVLCAYAVSSPVPVSSSCSMPHDSADSPSASCVSSPLRNANQKGHRRSCALRESASTSSLFSAYTIAQMRLSFFIHFAFLRKSLVLCRVACAHGNNHSPCSRRLAPTIARPDSAVSAPDDNAHL